MESLQVVSKESSVFLEYFRCPSEFASFELLRNSPSQCGFFRFGPALCFGETDGGPLVEIPEKVSFDALSLAEVSPGPHVRLSFNPTEVIENLRRERYLVRGARERLLQSFYYRLRPILPFEIRRLVQQSVTRRRRARTFPAWPVDYSVEQICELLLQLTIQATGVQELPFIWFWPEGKSAALMVTHDVEEQSGVDSCGVLMDMDTSYGIKAAFQVIPEGRYPRVDRLIAHIRERGFETNIHDLDHDGRLYEDKELFRQRAEKINQYGRTYQMAGFRAGAMHRNQDWFEFLEFHYDMSVPTVSHLEPQRGGCCTVMPYFVGNLLELPLTTVQDHALFYILGQYSIDLWKQQVEMISAHHGLISFIVHPDYTVRRRERQVYCNLLEYISQQVREQNLWSAFPGEINRWWRDRSQMRLQCENGAWRICGLGSRSARVAYASIIDGRLRYRIRE